MPIYNWMKMRSLNDYSFMFKDKDLHTTEVSDRHTEVLSNYYLEMLTEFFNEFGQTKAFKDEIEIKEKILSISIEFAKTGDKILLNDLDMLNKKLLDKQANNIDKSLKVDDKLENKEMIARVSKTLLYPVDIRKMSVLSFYTQLTISEEQL